MMMMNRGSVYCIDYDTDTLLQSSSSSKPLNHGMLSTYQLWILLENRGKISLSPVSWHLFHIQVFTVSNKVNVLDCTLLNKQCKPLLDLYRARKEKFQESCEWDSNTRHWHQRISSWKLYDKHKQLHFTSAQRLCK